MLFTPFLAVSQDADSLTKKPESFSLQSDSSNHAAVNKINGAADEGVKMDAKVYFTLLAADFKEQFTSPFRTKRKDWLKVGGFTFTLGAVALANRPINRFAKNLHANNRGIASASRYITDFGGLYEVYTLGGFFTYGLIFKSQKAKTTAMLATQSYIIAGAISTAGKYLFALQRPYYTDPISNKSAPIFRGPFYAFKKAPNGEKLSSSDYSSFPSGHTTAAFAAATVYAMEYKDKPLIPILSYSAATLIGLSRLTENKHWPIDVVAGAMLGYLSGRQVVNNYHRYSKVRKHQKSAPKPVTFNLQYLNKQVVPGLVYNF
ncbi:MAG: phosphatase family protein [Segetibacter sp.]|nr:phosphatase family protein [Segetibacter sp.]